jgi:hypothetical protein
LLDNLSIVLLGDTLASLFVFSVTLAITPEYNPALFL